MKTFKNIDREYVNPIDLNVLGKTYNTLEQGHKEAVKAASDLEITMANLPLNEAEAEWRQQKIADIKQTVLDNTVYGNAYGALDNIIAKAGDIASDQGMIGRLQAQKDYTAFREELDKRQDLPQNYKEMYKELNPYYYEDKIDEKTGRIISSSKWQPTYSPTQVVPLNEIMNQGLKWAAKEAGEGSATRWIDANGNITNNPNASFDGQVFNSTTNKWERLSKEKILQGIKASIESTPGAKESLEQDHRVALWEHAKAVKANDDKPVVSDVTDSEGVLLTPEQYLFKRVDPMAQAASYYNSYTTTNYGNGLATYKAAQKQAAAARQAERLSMSQATISGRNTPIEIDINVGSKMLETRNVTNNAIQNLYKRFTGSNLPIKNGDKIENMEQLLNKQDVRIEDRQQFRALVKTYNEAIDNLNAYTSQMTDENDKRNFEFASRMQSGGQLISKENGGSEYDDKAIASINKMYGDKGTELRITVSPKTLNEVKNVLNGGQYQGYKNLGVTISNGQIIVPKDKMNALPMITSVLDEAKRIANKGIMGTIGGAVFDRYTIKTYDAEGNDVTSYVRGGDMSYNYSTVPTVEGRRLAGIYNKSSELSSNISNKYSVAPNKITVSSLNLDGNNFTEGTLFNQYQKGIISKQQYDTYTKYYNDSFDAILANQDFSQTEMYYLGDKDTAKKRIVSSEDRFNYGSEIVSAIKDKRVTVTPSVIPGVNGPSVGYNITVLPEKDSNAAPKRFYVPNLVNETAAKYIIQDPYVQAWNTVSIVGSTRSTRYITDDNVNPKLGTISLTGIGNDTYVADFNGIKATIDNDTAVKLTNAFNEYNACKSTYLSTGTGEIKGTMANTIGHAAKEIGGILGVSPENIIVKLLDDINK